MIQNEGDLEFSFNVTLEKDFIFKFISVLPLALLLISKFEGINK